jgi:hypothetical protein
MTAWRGCNMQAFSFSRPHLHPRHGLEMRPSLSTFRFWIWKFPGGGEASESFSRRRAASAIGEWPSPSIVSTAMDFHEFVDDLGAAVNFERGLLVGWMGLRYSPDEV